MMPKQEPSATKRLENAKSWWKWIFSGLALASCAVAGFLMNEVRSGREAVQVEMRAAKTSLQLEMRTVNTSLTEVRDEFRTQLGALREDVRVLQVHTDELRDVRRELHSHSMSAGHSVLVDRVDRLEERVERLENR